MIYSQHVPLMKILTTLNIACQSLERTPEDRLGASPKKFKFTFFRFIVSSSCPSVLQHIKEAMMAPAEEPAMIRGKSPA